MKEGVTIIGCGFIGSQLAGYLARRGYRVSTLDIRQQPTWLREFDIPHEICDIRNANTLLQKIGEPQILIHTAIIQIPRINEDKKLAYEVNVLGTQNVCEIASRVGSVKGMLLTSSWHVFGEFGLSGEINEEFGYRPEKTEPRARLYAISKVLQECLINFYNAREENKVFGAVRLGTVLGEGMPEKTAANIFITNALQGKEITPFKHSMYRPMLYVTIEDVCKAFDAFIKKILKEPENSKENNVVNLFYPEPMTIIEVANTIREAVEKHTKGKIRPIVKVVDKGLPQLYEATDKNNIKVSLKRLREFLGIQELKNPRETLEEIVMKRLNMRGN